MQDCIDIGNYLHALFAIVIVLNVVSVWRMKKNALEGIEKKIDALPFWHAVACDFILPKRWLKPKGIKWWYLGVVSSVGMATMIIAYLYFGNQDWVCQWGPEKGPADIIMGS